MRLKSTYKTKSRSNGKSFRVEVTRGGIFIKYSSGRDVGSGWKGKATNNYNKIKIRPHKVKRKNTFNKKKKT